MNRLPYLREHMTRLNPSQKRQKRAFLRNLGLLALVVAFDVWFLYQREQAYHEQFNRLMDSLPSQNPGKPHGIDLEWRTVTDAGVELKQTDKGISFTF